MTHTPAFRKLIRGLQQARRQNLAEDGEDPPLPKGDPVDAAPVREIGGRRGRRRAICLVFRCLDA
jgi:hypothetical protein